MKLSLAAEEILSLLDEGERRGAPPPSVELREFLSQLAASPGLKKPSNRKKTSSARTSDRAPSRVGARTKRPTEVEMSKTIEELAQKLRNSFQSEAQFETVLKDPNTQALSKANVVTLFKKVFDAAQPSKAMTKPELFNAMRRERINWVRGRA